MSQSVLHMFPSKSFIVSSLIIRSLIHFEFISVYGVREYSNFIRLHVAVQSSQHCLLKRLFSPSNILISFVIGQVATGVWVYVWTSYPILLIYISVFVLVPDWFYNIKSRIFHSHLPFGREICSIKNGIFLQFCNIKSGIFHSPLPFGSH